MPVLEGALERSVDLAAAMDARGYGRTTDEGRVARRTTAVLVFGGLLGVCVGTYGLLDATASTGWARRRCSPASRLAAVGLHLGGRRSGRTTYRPDPWALPEWLVAGSGVVAAVAVFVDVALHPASFFLASVRTCRPCRGSPPPASWSRLLPAVLAPPLPVAGDPPALRTRPAGSRCRLIEMHDVGVDLRGRRRAGGDRVDLTVPEGELVLVVGRTGSGKSTLLRTVNGLVPHFSGGTLHGRVLVDGRDTRTHRPRDLADIVGYVGQDPLAGFVTDTVEDELAYGMESLGLPADVMRSGSRRPSTCSVWPRCANRPVADLSGGQQQRVAIGSVLTSHPRVLVLDEPTSALDPVAAEDVLAPSAPRARPRPDGRAGRAPPRARRPVRRPRRSASRRGPAGAARPAGESCATPRSPRRSSSWAGSPVGPLPLSVRDARRRAGPLRTASPAYPPRR